MSDMNKRGPDCDDDGERGKRGKRGHDGSTGPAGPIGPTGPAGVGTSSSLCLIYRPGSGAAGPTVFDTWAGIVAQLAATRAANGGGCYAIMIDDAIVSPAVIPAGTYDMTDVTLLGRSDQQTMTTVVEGVQFTKLRKISDQLMIEFTGATPPVSDFVVGAGLLDLFVMDIHSAVTCSGTGAFFRASNTGGIPVVALLNASLIATGSAPAIEVAAAGVIFGIAGLDFGSLQQNTIKGVAGSSLILGILSSSAVLSEQQPAFLGALDPASQTITRFFPSSIITSSTSVQQNQVARCDSTGGAITITLPSALDLRGEMVLIKDVGGAAAANPITVAPSGADTVDGSLSAIISTNKGSLTLVSDGVSNWMIV